MAKNPTVSYVCSNCGSVYSKWAGRCSSCGEWNTLEEEVSLSPGVGLFKSNGRVLTSQPAISAASHDQLRLFSGTPEFDSVLGGGIVSGSVVLLAGQPGIGKSTLLLQIANSLAKSANVLYVSGEESAHQVSLRARRLGVSTDKLQLATSMVADDIAKTIESGNYRLVVVDSIQTVICQSISSVAGSVSQIAASTQLIMSSAKGANCAVIIVGHVTKEGSIAGPKVLEHMVDVVLQLEGDTYGGFKVLRASKNRYGPTNEAGIFEMTEKGLEVVDNPSAALLAERQISDGSVVHATMEGSRPILVEVQALVNPTSYGYPKRTASGVDLNRLNLLIAVLERRTKLKLSDQDIFINIVGGIKLNEPAADLAICMAIGSAAKGLKLRDNAVVFGEVGLSGEIRHVPFIDKRLAEAKKLGFNVAIGPHQKTATNNKMLQQVGDLKKALNQFLKKGEI